MAHLDTQSPPEEKLQTQVQTNGRWAGYWAILGARMKELWREPEVIFWVFVFPLLLAFGLGIAFRDKPADVTSIAVVNNARTRSRWSSCCNALRRRTPFMPMCSTNQSRSINSGWVNIRW